MKLISVIGIIVCCLFPISGIAKTIPFDDWVNGVKAEALKKGISAATLDVAFKGVKPNPRIVELDKKQPEFRLTFQQYMDRVVPQSRIDRGRKNYAKNKTLLEEVAKKYGVQARFIVALWGIETDFGRVTGGFPVITSLVTLAYDGRRSKFFRTELFHALRILDEKHITADAMIGSWAGAMGQSQFMPSSFNAYAVDYDGDGKRDIWGTKADVFASAANYLSKSGWRNDLNWGRAVKLPKGFDRALAGRKKSKPLSAWQKLGVRRSDGSDLPARDLKSSIILPQKGQMKPAFVAYHNFHVILKWNRSDYFALAVGHLADGIGEN
jgi:membrane-bound lytic murein transglycosylase B